MVFRSNSVAQLSLTLGTNEQSLGYCLVMISSRPPVSFRVAAGICFVSSPTVVAVYCQYIGHLGL